MKPATEIPEASAENGGAVRSSAVLDGDKGCGNCKHNKVWPAEHPCGDCNQLWPERDGHENTRNYWEAI